MAAAVDGRASPRIGLTLCALCCAPQVADLESQLAALTKERERLLDLSNKLKVEVRAAAVGAYCLPVGYSPHLLGADGE